MDRHLSDDIYIKLGIGLTVLYVVIFHLEKVVGTNVSTKIHESTEKCVVTCKDKLCKANNMRGKSYYLLGDKNAPTNCLITKWEISHFLLHVMLGYWTNIYVSQGLSIGFELYECLVYDCGSILDLFYNFAGYLTGYYLNKFINK